MFLKEKLDFKVDSMKLYVWKSSDESLGFNQDKEGMFFAESLISLFSGTVLFPEIKFINPTDKLEKHISNLRGITFFNSDVDFTHLKDEYERYIKETKKNIILSRYGKATKEISLPEVLSWNQNKRYTQAFFKYTEDKQLEYLIWDWSDLGIFFYTVSKSYEIEQNIKKISKKLKIKLSVFTNMNEMPFH